MNILTFTPEGEVVGLYTEIIPLTELGTLHIERWTVLEFNNHEEEWEVRRMTKAGHPDPTVLFSHPSRQACLHWEQWQFNGCPREDELTYRPSAGRTTRRASKPSPSTMTHHH
jgi:hypothetical protein